MFNGNTHYKLPCSIAMFVYQRVYIINPSLIPMNYISIEVLYHVISISENIPIKSIDFHHESWFFPHRFSILYVAKKDLYSGSLATS